MVTHDPPGLPDLPTSNADVIEIKLPCAHCGRSLQGVSREAEACPACDEPLSYTIGIEGPFEGIPMDDARALAWGVLLVGVTCMVGYPLALHQGGSPLGMVLGLSGMVFVLVGTGALAGTAHRQWMLWGPGGLQWRDQGGPMQLLRPTDMHDVDGAKVYKRDGEVLRLPSEATRGPVHRVLQTWAARQCQQDLEDACRNAIKGHDPCRGCGYDLHSLTGADDCPECGRPVIDSTALGRRLSRRVVGAYRGRTDSHRPANEL